jgi:hypothetical protein
MMGDFSHSCNDSHAARLEAADAELHIASEGILNHHVVHSILGSIGRPLLRLIRVCIDVSQRVGSAMR